MSGDASLGVFQVLPAGLVPNLSTEPDEIDLLEEALSLVDAQPEADWAWQKWAQKAERFLRMDGMRRDEESL